MAHQAFASFKCCGMAPLTSPVCVLPVQSNVYKVVGDIEMSRPGMEA